MGGCSQFLNDAFQIKKELKIITKKNQKIKAHLYEKGQNSYGSEKSPEE